jgi:glycosyltransferase involved in cell wall biosynthesis
MKRILYIQVGVGFLHVNRSVISELKRHFPGTTIELYDLLPEIKKSPLIILWNSLTVLSEFFLDFLTLRKKITDFKYHFLGTTFLFRHMSKIVAKKLEETRYDAIIQTQCLCDSSGMGVPNYIYTDHTNLNNLNYKWTSVTKYLRTQTYVELERQAFLNATGIFVMSRNIHDSLVTQYGVDPQKITMAYVGSNTTPPENHDDAKYFNKNIIFVGKDWERKGGPLLVEAFRDVLSAVPDATLSIVGCSPKIDVRNCHVYGEVDLAEVARLYQKASIFCFPTVREPFGIVYIEAMLNKLPIVTNNMGAAPSLVTPENGYLLEHNVNDYSEVLIELLQNPEKCKAMGEESYRIAREFYNWQTVGREMAERIHADAKQLHLTKKAEIA